MPARQLTPEMIKNWQLQGRSPGKRTLIFNAEWDTLCELAIQALEDAEELAILRQDALERKRHE